MQTHVYLVHRIWYEKLIFYKLIQVLSTLYREVCEGNHIYFLDYYRKLHINTEYFFLAPTSQEF